MLKPAFKIFRTFALLILFIAIALLLFLPLSSVFDFDLNINTPHGFIIEYTPAGSVLKYNDKFNQPVCYNKDSEGNYFVADRYTPAFYAFDKNDNLIFIYSLLTQSISDIKKTIDNTYLLSIDCYPPSILEVNNLGQIIFSNKNFDAISESLKIDHDKYLILSPFHNTIILINTNGNIIRESPPELCDSPKSIQLLENNHYLLTCNNIVKEIDPDFNVIKEYKEFINPSYARKTFDGHFAAANLPSNELIFYDNNLNIIKKIYNLKVSSINVSPDGNFLVTGTENFNQ